MISKQEVSAWKKWKQNTMDMNYNKQFVTNMNTNLLKREYSILMNRCHSRSTKKVLPRPKLIRHQAQPIRKQIIKNIHENVIHARL